MASVGRRGDGLPSLPNTTPNPPNTPNKPPTSPTGKKCGGSHNRLGERDLGADFPNFPNIFLILDR